MTRIPQILDNTLPLEAAGRADGKNTFNVSGAPFALGAETAFTPQNGLSYDSFGQIVRRFHTCIVDKRPQKLSLVEDAAALSRQRFVAIGSFFQQDFYTLNQRSHTALKCLPQQCAVPNPLPQMQNLLGQTKQFASDSTHKTFGLRQRLKIPFQMGPAQLSQTRKTIITAPAVTVKNLGKCAQQLSCCRLSSAGLNHEDRGAGTAQYPQPTFKSIASRPAGFIGMSGWLCLDIVCRFLIRLFQCLGQLSFTLTQAAKAHRNGKDLVHHRQRLALAGVDIPGQYANNRQYTRTKVLTLDVIRQRMIDKFAAFAALVYRLDIFDDLRLYGRYIWPAPRNLNKVV